MNQRTAQLKKLSSEQLTRSRGPEQEWSGGSRPRLPSSLLHGCPFFWKAWLKAGLRLVVSVADCTTQHKERRKAESKGWRRREGEFRAGLSATTEHARSCTTYRLLPPLGDANCASNAASVSVPSSRWAERNQRLTEAVSCPRSRSREREQPGRSQLQQLWGLTTAPHRLCHGGRGPASDIGAGPVCYSAP